MSGSADFNVDNYSIKDLLQIFEIKEPMTEEELTEHMDEKISQYEDDNKENYANFFSDGLNVLLEKLTQMNLILRGRAPQTDANNFGENILQNQYYTKNNAMNAAATNTPNRQSNASLVNNNHSTQAQRRLLVPNVYNPALTQGNMNPIMQNTYTTTVNIDSHYREIRKDAGSSSCPSDTLTGKINILDSSTDFTINLSESLTNVIGITIGTLEIPMNAYYPFSEQYGTTSFATISGGVTYCIDIPEGFYPSSASIPGMLDISSAINNHLPPGIHFSIDPNTQKSWFTADGSFNLIFYDDGCSTDCTSDNCFKYNTGKKLDSNLGWLLGFRQPKYSNITGISSEAIVNPWGTRYLILEVDDLNRNRNSGNLVSMTNNQDKFKLPSYYNKTRENYPACPEKDYNIVSFTGPSWPTPPIVGGWMWSVAPGINPDLMPPSLYGISHEILAVNGYVPLFEVQLRFDCGEELWPPGVSTMSGGPPPPPYFIYSGGGTTAALTWTAPFPQFSVATSPFVGKGGISFKGSKGDPSGVQLTRPCRRGTPANTPLIDGSNNLTTAQKYTITEIINARQTISQDRYFSPVTSNVLYRFPVPRNNLNMLHGTAAPTIIKNDQGMANARRYFGPVTIKTLKVRLLNDKGIVLDLNNMDFSFSLLVERLYQY